MPLVVLEGIDGCGKTTQINNLKNYFSHYLADDAYLFLREPGGTVLGETLRSTLLDPATGCCAEAELMLYLASRMQLVETRIKPALLENKLVILDRYYYSTIAYQIRGLQLNFMPSGNLEMLAKASALNAEPDLVFFLNIPLSVASDRREARGKDRIELREDGYHARVHTSYCIQAERRIFVTIDGTLPQDQVFQKILQTLKERKLIS